MNRVSSFAILSDSILDGKRVLMNGCFGGIDIITSDLAAFLENTISSNPHGQAYVHEASFFPETFANLIERGHITSRTHEEEKALATEIALGMHELEKRRPCFMIIPSMDCNYRCTYCFERHLQKGFTSDTGNFSYKKKNVVMHPEMIPRIYNAIGEIRRDAGLADAGGMVILYGGEPLDVANKDLILDIVHQGAAKGYWFSAISNGHDLDAFAPIVNRDMIRQIQVTIDGPRDLHNRRRIHRGRDSSFDKIVDNVRSVLNRGGVEVHIRCHVDPDNIHLFEELLAFFVREGWTDNESVIIYANTLYEKNAGEVCAKIMVRDIDSRLDSLVGGHWNVFTSGPSVHIFRALQRVFRDGERFPLKGTYCSANFGNHIFAPDGNIYACWESIGKESSRIGALIEGGFRFEDASAQKWFSRNVAGIEECLECRFALVCGGGCAQYAEYNKGSLNKPFCDDFQQIFTMALADEVIRWLNLKDCQT